MVVELSLTWDHQRGRAHNIEVLTSDRKIRLLVECRSVDAGPIAADQVVALADGRKVPIGEIACEGAKSQEPPPALVGYYLKPDTDPWSYAPLSRHRTCAVQRESVSESPAEEYEIGRAHV